MQWCTKLDKYQECYQITITITLNISSVGSLFGSDPGANVDEVGMKYWDSLFLKWKSKACYYYSLLNTMEKKCRRTSLPPPGPLSSSSSLELLLQLLAVQHLEGCSSSVSWRTWVRMMRMITKWSKRGLLSLCSSSSSHRPEHYLQYVSQVFETPNPTWRCYFTPRRKKMIFNLGAIDGGDEGGKHVDETTGR